MALPRKGVSVKVLRLIVPVLMAATLVCAGPSVAGGQEPGAVAKTDEFRVAVVVQASKPRGRLRPIWRFFGADEPNYGTMAHGRRLLASLGQLGPKAVYFRAHNLLCSGDRHARAGDPRPRGRDRNIHAGSAIPLSPRILTAFLLDNIFQQSYIA